MNRVAIESMSLANLAEMYNTLRPDAPVKKFSDRKTAVRRVLAAVEAAEAARAAATPAKPAEQSEEAPSGRSGPRKPRATQYIPDGPEKAPRAGTKRAALLAALLDAGLTTEEMQARFGWAARDCRDAVSLLTKQNGYATYLGNDGRWHAAVRDVEPTTVRSAAQPGPKRRK